METRNDLLLRLTREALAGPLGAVERAELEDEAIRLAPEPRLEELRNKARRGDRVAAAAVRAYRTDAELEAAAALSAAQDFTDGGDYVDTDGVSILEPRGMKDYTP